MSESQQTLETASWLPCPFCSSTDLITIELWISSDDGEELADGIECKVCDAQARASVWNNRPQEVSS